MLRSSRVVHPNPKHPFLYLTSTLYNILLSVQHRTPIVIIKTDMLLLEHLRGGGTYRTCRQWTDFKAYCRLKVVKPRLVREVLTEEGSGQGAHDRAPGVQTLSQLEPSIELHDQAPRIPVHHVLATILQVV